MLDSGTDSATGTGPDAGPDDGLRFDDVELIDLTPLAAPVAGPRERTRGSRRGLGIGAVGALVALGLGLWALGGTDDAAGERGAGPESTEPVPTTRRPTPSTTRPTTTVDDEVEGPLLGRPVGWSLLIGGWSRSGLDVVDLDTGREATIEADVMPMAVVGDLLAVQDDVQPPLTTVRVVPLSDPAAPGLTVGQGEQWRIGGAAAAGAGDDLWLGVVEGEAFRWRLVHRRGDGSIVIADEIDGGPLATASQRPGMGPEVVGTQDGKVFALEGGTYRQVHTGTVLATSRDFVLVMTCSTPRGCTPGWLQRDTWEAVDRPLPPDLDWATQLTPDGRFLVYQDADSLYDGDGSALLFDVEQGRVVEGVTPQGYLTLTVSADDRLLAYVASGRVEVYDVERDEVVPIPYTGVDSYGDRMVFVPSGSTGGVAEGAVGSGGDDG